MSTELTVRHELVHIVLRFDQGEAMAWLHARGEVLADQTEEGGHRLTVRLDAADRARFDRSWPDARVIPMPRSEEHTSELQSLMRISYAVFCLKKKNIEN